MADQVQLQVFKPSVIRKQRTAVEYRSIYIYVNSYTLGLAKIIINFSWKGVFLKFLDFIIVKDR